MPTSRRTLTPAGLALETGRDRWHMHLDRTLRPSGQRHHLAAINRELLRVASRENRRLIVELPPRHGKSELISKAFPCWYLSTFPDHSIIACSYEARLAAQWGEAARDLFREYGPSLFGLSVRHDISSRDNWRITGYAGGMRTAGVNGAITGKNADLLLIDDPIKNDEQAWSPHQRERLWRWFTATAMQRLEPHGVCIVVGTRWHRDDLIGRLLKAQEKGGEQWVRLRFPAIAEEDDPLGRAVGEALWPERLPLDFLLARKTALEKAGTPWAWDASYQQRPPSRDGSAEWPEDYFPDDIWVDRDQLPPDFRVKVMALDPSKGKDAKAGDYSAFTILTVSHDGLFYVEADLDRRDVDRMVDDAVVLYRRHRPQAIAIEANAFQELVKDSFDRKASTLGLIPRTFAVVNTVNKHTRIRSAIGPLLAQGKLRFVKDSPGTQILIEQLRDFPHGQHDDGPDSLEMALTLIEEHFSDL